MRKLRLLLFLFAVLSITSCKKSADNYEDSEGVSTTTDEDGNEVYPDGTYCADIDYYNPDTNTRSNYTLNVEVESNEVTVIQWSNGGWLDSSHFTPEELDSSGSCSFTTYDGKQYDVQITGSECNDTDTFQVSDDEDEVKCPECGGDKSEFDDYCYFCKRKFTCPECGGKKYKYDNVCEECKDKAEHTCKRCGQHDSFMFSTDDLCSDCKRDNEDKRRQEEENDD
jgi:hypothetical protein